MRKSNKLLIFVACLVLLTALVIGLVACDPTPSQHQHTAAETWSSDADGHWHDCVDNDGGKLDSAEHAFGEWLIDSENKHYKKCATCLYETPHEAHDLTINAEKTAFECECGYSEAHTHQLGNLIQDGANGHHQACTTEGCGYVTSTTQHELSINAEKTAFECECGYSEAHTHELGDPINDGATGHHQACETEGCGYVTATGNHSLHINSDYTKYECECGYSENHTHELTINEGKTAFECECGYSEAHTHQLGALTPNGATGHYKECQTAGCGYRETGSHTLTINPDKTAFTCECGYSEAHTHQLGDPINDNEAGHHQACETEGCGYVTEKSKHELTINEKKDAFECECGYSEAHSHTFGALTSDGEDGHHKDCTTEGCGYRETGSHTLTINPEKTAFTCECGYSEEHTHSLGDLINDNEAGHHQECETPGCGYVGEKSNHELKINAGKTAFECECGYSEAHTHDLGEEYISDGEDGHHQKCQTEGCGYETTTEGHSLKYVADDGEETHHAECEKCDYKGASTAHNPGKDATKVDDDYHAFKCADCTADVKEAHRTKVVADEGAGTHHTECEVCEYRTESTAHISDEEYHKGEGKHWFECTECNAKMDEAEHAKQGDIQSDEAGHFYLCVCGEEVERAEHVAGEEYGHSETEHWKTCTECEYQLEKTAHAPGENAVSQCTGAKKATLHKFTCEACKTACEVAHNMTTDEEGGVEYCKDCQFSPWTVENKNGTWTVTAYQGTGTEFGEITFPSKYQGNQITAITGASSSKPMFYNTAESKKCTSIQKVVIPEGYTTINAYVFTTPVEDLYLPSTLETVASSAFTTSTAITNVYFADFENWLMGFTLSAASQTPFNRATGSTEHSNVFAKQEDGSYTQIKSIVFDENLDYIGPWALYNANITEVTFNFANLGGITVSKSALEKLPLEKIYVSSIDDYATKIDYAGSSPTSVFANLDAQLYIIGQDTPVTELTFGPTVNTLAANAFKGATIFKKLTLTDALQDLSTALDGAKGFEEIHVPSLKKLIALTSSSSIRLWNYSPSAKLFIAEVETKDITIDDDALEGITDDTLRGVFYKCATIESVKFTNTRDIILNQTFNQEKADNESILNKVDLGEHIKELTAALSYIKNLTGEFRVPASVTKISDLRGCTGLTVIYLPATVKEYDGSFDDCTAKIVFAKDAEPEPDRFYYSKGYQGTEIVLPAKLSSLMAGSTFILSKAPNLKVIYFGGDEAAWKTLLNTITDDAYRAQYEQMSVRYLKEDYPGDDEAATGKYWYYTDEGNTAIWMKGHETKDNKYLMFEQYTYYVNLDETTSLTLAPFIGEATFAAEADGIEVSEAGVVTPTKAGKHTVKATLKDNADISVDLTVIAYTNTYYITGTLGGKAVADKQAAYTFSTTAEHEEYTLLVTLKANDSFKLYAKDADGALGKDAFDEAGSASENVSVAEDGTITVAKDANLNITLKVTDGNKYQFAITVNNNIVIAIQLRDHENLTTVLVSTSVEMPTKDTQVALVLTYNDVPADKRSYTNIGFSVTFPDGTINKYVGQDEHIIKFSGNAFATKSAKNQVGWTVDDNQNDMWYNYNKGVISSGSKWTFTFTINSEGIITACAITK